MSSRLAWETIFVWVLEENSDRYILKIVFLDWLTWHMLGNPTRAVFIFKRLRNGSSKGWMFQQPHQVLKVWGFPGELLVSVHDRNWKNQALISAKQYGSGGNRIDNLDRETQRQWDKNQSCPLDPLYLEATRMCHPHLGLVSSFLKYCSQMCHLLIPDSVKLATMMNHPSNLGLVLKQRVKVCVAISQFIYPLSNSSQEKQWTLFSSSLRRKHREVGYWGEWSILDAGKVFCSAEDF